MTGSDPLAVLMSAATEILLKLAPNWQPPVLEHPHAVQFKDPFHMMARIVPGDQIMMVTESGIRHHGIYLGFDVQSDRPVVADFWGKDKNDAKISVRNYSDFVIGAVGFAKAEYPEGTALDHNLSLQLARQFVEYAKTHTIKYDAATCNCEHFATLCRCLRCVSSVALGG